MQNIFIHSIPNSHVGFILLSLFLCRLSALRLSCHNFKMSTLLETVLHYETVLTVLLLAGMQKNGLRAEQYPNIVFVSAASIMQISVRVFPC